MVTTRDIDYEFAGTALHGRLGLPDGDDVRPAVLIAHEGPGLEDFQRDRARTFAELGYVAFGLDYHGTLLTDRDEMMQRLGALSSDLDMLRAIGTAGLDILLNEPRTDRSKVAAVGYCFGGTMVLELARGGADLKAVVGMHPGLGTTRPEDARNIVGKVLMCVGADDPFIPVETRLAFEEEMRAAAVDWRMNLYGGVVHSFTHPWADAAGLEGIKYDEGADRRSTREMLDLFDEVFA